MNIAIDGPAGAGKSTIAKLVANKLNYIYVDTGAMYRTIALYILRKNIDIDNEKELTDSLKNVEVSIEYDNGEQLVILNGENVSTLIRSEEVGNMASLSSAKPIVREKLFNLQIDLAASNDVVMDGRDIGTNVLPNAELKIYLTASPRTRATRRYNQLLEKGINANIDEIENDIIQRDNQDMNRDIAPLKQAEDAVFLDSSELTIDEVVQAIINNLKK